MNERKKERLKAELNLFKKQYGRKKRKGFDPNDRHYDRKLEHKIKTMRPEELDELMNQ